MGNAQSARVFRFGPFETDLANRQLFKKGVPVSLTGQPFEVLALLLEHPRQLVTREQLRTRLWPSGTVVEFDHSIAAAVTKLREVLGDDSQHPRYIATVPRHGYRFIASVSTPALAALESIPSPSGGTALPSPPAVRQHGRGRKWFIMLLLAVLAIGVAYVVVSRFGISRHSAPVQSAVSGTQDVTARAASSTTTVAFNPPPHSIAVLPFVNLSGDPSQEYLSDGLSEELLNSLSRINELQVAARTSSFYFKGEHADLPTIALKLNVASVLEGSVRRSGHTIRVTAQLNNAVTGYHLWSQTYDRELGDVLKLQTEIASAVASALKVTLLRDVATEMNIGGTRNPAAYDAYLRSASAYWQAVSASDLESVRAGYQEAVRLDPNFALAYAEWSIALNTYALLVAHGPSRGDFHRQARALALKAVALAPELAEGHLALSFIHQVSLDFTRANDELERAMALAPGNARVLRNYGVFAVWMGHTDAGIAAARRAVALDPLNVNSHSFLGGALRDARRYDEALAAFQDSLSLRPKDPTWPAVGRLIYYALGDFEKMRSVCEGVGQEAVKDFQDCLALAYQKLGRQADAETALARFTASEGNAGAYGYATVYAQWGNTSRALEWLETALQLRDPGLKYLKTEPLMDPLRKEPRFQAVMRELKFPN